MSQPRCFFHGMGQKFNTMALVSPAPAVQCYQYDLQVSSPDLASSSSYFPVHLSGH